MLWYRYRAKRGTLNLGMRIDRAASRILCTYFNSLAKRDVFELADFSPFDEKLKPEEGSIEQAFAILSAVAKSAPEEGG
ncbi:hypothetical protein [Halopseudomonas laoshanensis]|uniref:hypothetical protein n=1 Tax=Halopseudomonas laoshanensis TaxID=2268758 RepID=UPI003734E597